MNYYIKNKEDVIYSLKAIKYQVYGIKIFILK